MATIAGKLQPRIIKGGIKVLENTKPVLRTKKRSQDTYLHRQKPLAMSASYCVISTPKKSEKPQSVVGDFR